MPKVSIMPRGTTQRTSSHRKASGAIVDIVCVMNMDGEIACSDRVVHLNKANDNEGKYGGKQESASFR